MKRRIIVFLSIVGVLAFAVAPALAAKAGSSRAGGSRIALVPPAAAADSGSTEPTFGDQVTFDVSTTATDYPWVYARCYQNRTMVWGQWAGFFESYTDGQMFTLGPTRSWQGGAAECTAELVKRDDYKYRVLARTTFDVSA